MSDTTNPKDALGLRKPPLRLIPAPALLYLSRVMGLGAVKYGPYNWRGKPVRFTVYLEAAMRHILSALDGENIDPESHMPPEAHAMACMAIILDARATGNLIDDRPPPGAAEKLIAELTQPNETPLRDAPLPPRQVKATDLVSECGCPAVFGRQIPWVGNTQRAYEAMERHQRGDCPGCGDDEAH
jgi:hypothetical protein